MRCEVCVIDAAGALTPGPWDQVRAVVEAACEDAGHRDCSLTVRLVDDAESARLHAHHFHDPTPTDVMTFPDGSRDPVSGRTHLADLAVGVDVARRVAAHRGRTVEDEVVLYVLHGLLHVLGSDDRSDDEAHAMWERQRRLLASVGIVLDHPS